ncbi:DUF2637 domain-containing protein [Rathayibacter soli]
MATAVAGTVFIAAGAFWLSFTALADLARRSGIAAQEAWAWPLIVDGIIVVATVAIVVLAGQPGAWYPWLLLATGALVSVTANAMHAIAAADADVPGPLAACVAAVPPLVLLAITHLTVVLTRPAISGVATTADGSIREAERPAGARQVAVRLHGQGHSNKAIARQLGVHPSTVGRWFAALPAPETAEQHNENEENNA